MRTLLAAVIVGLMLVPMASALAVGDTSGTILEHEVGDETTTSTTEPSTNTTEPSTTTTKPSTTTTQPATTSSADPTTTTTAERKTTSTTPPATTSTSRSETTTTTQLATTTTGPATTTSTPAHLVGPTTPPGSGLRGTATGMLADYDGDLMVGLDLSEVNVLSVGVTSDFSMAVEAFRAARLWIAVLALMLVATVLIGVDRHRSRQMIA